MLLDKATSVPPRWQLSPSPLVASYDYSLHSTGRSVARDKSRCQQTSYLTLKLTLPSTREKHVSGQELRSDLPRLANGGQRRQSPSMIATIGVADFIFPHFVLFYCSFFLSIYIHSCGHKVRIIPAAVHLFNMIHAHHTCLDVMRPDWSAL